MPYLVLLDSNTGKLSEDRLFVARLDRICWFSADGSALYANEVQLSAKKNLHLCFWTKTFFFNVFLLHHHPNLH